MVSGTPTYTCPQTSKQGIDGFSIHVSWDCYRNGYGCLDRGYDRDASPLSVSKVWDVGCEPETRIPEPEA